ncbi:MAG TPA: substrate-binding domain-containing protein [Gemmatimonadaceae bacterium]|nr:substrate-binding domain-containing protein [Gemmatimonadaceae bacterium]
MTRREENLSLVVPLVVLLGVAAATHDGRAFAAVTPSAQPAAPSAIRICADPNNLPFSNASRAGFENKIADVIGAELHRPVAYTWWAQRRGFVRNTLNAGECDLVVGTVSGMEMLATTRPYYKSTYVFVSRHDRHLDVKSFDDTKLRRLKIGVQLIGDDFSNTPPAHALSNRGIVRNVVGFPVYGDYRQANPAARIMDAVIGRKVDVAVVWGPLAGYFAKQSPVALDVVPVSPQVDLPYLPFVFDIAMGTRRADSTFRHTLDDIIERRHATIDSILGAYGVPRADRGRRTYGN